MEGKEGEGRRERRELLGEDVGKVVTSRKSGTDC